MQDDPHKSVEILLVEDNPGDVRLCQEALKDARIRNRLNVVNDGVEAIEFLRMPGGLQPDIILLDLNLPRKDGREVLSEIKQDPRLMRIPVIVLTTSSTDEDILQSYNLHANCFITKPVDPRKFFDVFRSIDQFWFSIVRLPSEVTP